MMGKRVAIHPILMMIAILAGVPFMGFVGFILGRTDGPAGNRL
jgi:predicted PurR-regulated permease PerM